jgi:hypothetical protein
MDEVLLTTTWNEFRKDCNHCSTDLSSNGFKCNHQKNRGTVVLEVGFRRCNLMVCAFNKNIHMAIRKIELAREHEREKERLNKELELSLQSEPEPHFVIDLTEYKPQREYY